MLNIYFIRHCKVDYTPEGKLRDQKHLSQEGRQQAIELKKKLQASKIDFDAIYSSEYARTIETLTPYGMDTKKKIQIKKHLEEAHFNWSYSKRYEESIRDLNFKIDGGESPKEARQRYNKTVQKIVKKHPNGNIIIVTHWAIFKEFLRDNFPKKNFDKIRLSNPDIYKIEIEKWVIKKYKRMEKLLPDNAIIREWS